MTGFITTGRCGDMYLTWQGTQKVHIRCRKSQGHPSAHEGRTSSGLSLIWTTEEGVASRKVPPPPLRKVTTPPIGWRAWYLKKHDILHSVSTDVAWEGPVMTTKKTRDGMGLCRVSKRNDSWDSDIETDPGVYSYKNLYNLHRYLGLGCGPHDYNVFGKIELHGHVVAHTIGYRAQKVIIRHLWYVVPKAMVHFTDVVEFEKRYQCPVELIPQDKLSGFIKYYSDPEEGK